MTLQLPKVQRRPTQRLDTPDISGPVRATQGYSAMVSAVTSGVVAAGGLAKKIVDRNNKQEFRDATMAVHKADTAFRRTYGGQEEYDMLSVEDENFMEVTQGRDPNSPVPAHAVYAQWRNKNYEAAMNKAAESITFQGTRDEFLSTQKSKSSSIFADDTVRATKQQVQYNAKRAISDMESSLNARDYEGARINMMTADISSAAKTAGMKDINKREQIDYFNQTIENRSLPAMKGALKRLVDDDSKTTSELTASEQKVLANQLRTAIGAANNANTSAVNSQLKLNAEDLKNQIEDMWMNKSVNLQTMEKNKKSLAVKNPVLVREAEWTLNNQPMVASVLRSSPEDQAAAYMYAKENAGGDMEKSYLVDKLGEAIDEGNRARQTDAMKWANDTGFIAMEPMDYSSPDTLGEGLGKRLKQVISIQDKYHEFTGFFTEAEMSNFGNLVENASIDEKLVIFGSVSQSLGEYASPLYEQLKKFDVSGTAALAGQIIARNPDSRVVAENILRGAELRRDNKVVQLEVKEAGLDATITEKFGMMFAGNRKHQGLMAEAFKDVWAVTKDSDKAFEQLTGGSVEYNGSVVQAPAPGVGDWKYAWHVRNIAPIWWEGENMRAHGYSATQLRSSVLDGSLKQIGMGEGVNNLVKSNGDIVTRPDGVTPLPFAIDMSEPTKWGEIRARQAKERGEVESAMKVRKDKAKAERRETFLRTWDEIGGPKKIGSMP